MLADCRPFVRIVYFSRTYTTHDRRFLCRLAQASHEVWFLRLEDDGIVYERRPLPAKVHLVDWPGGKRPVRSLSELMCLKPHFEAILARIQPDLLHAGPVPSCGFLAARTGFHPLLVMSWGSDIPVDGDGTELSRSVVRYTLQKADLLLCDCHAVQAKVEQIAGYTRDRIIRFPWGIDLQEFAPGAGLPALRKQNDWENGFVIVSTRTWAPGYGIEVLLEAFRLAQCLNSSLRLVLLGDGSLADQIDRFLSVHGLQHKVWRPGRIPEERLPDYFRAADLYASCTPSDGTSVSLLEALATGLPVVVSDNAGNREWVQPGENGWLARPGDASAFAELFLHAAAMGRGEQMEIAKKNRHLAEERANWHSNSLQLLAAYEQLANQAAGGRTAGFKLGA